MNKSTIEDIKELYYAIERPNTEGATYCLVIDTETNKLKNALYIPLTMSLIIIHNDANTKNITTTIDDPKYRLVSITGSFKNQINRMLSTGTNNTVIAERNGIVEVKYFNDASFVRPATIYIHEQNRFGYQPFAFCIESGEDVKAGHYYDYSYNTNTTVIIHLHDGNDINVDKSKFILFNSSHQNNAEAFDDYYKFNRIARCTNDMLLNMRDVNMIISETIPSLYSDREKMRWSECQLYSLPMRNCEFINHDINGGDNYMSYNLSFTGYINKLVDGVWMTMHIPDNNPLEIEVISYDAKTFIINNEYRMNFKTKYTESKICEINNDVKEEENVEMNNVVLTRGTVIKVNGVVEIDDNTITKLLDPITVVVLDTEGGKITCGLNMTGMLASLNEDELIKVVLTDESDYEVLNNLDIDEEESDADDDDAYEDEKNIDINDVQLGSNLLISGDVIINDSLIRFHEPIEVVCRGICHNLNVRMGNYANPHGRKTIICEVVDEDEVEDMQLTEFADENGKVTIITLPDTEVVVLDDVLKEFISDVTNDDEESISMVDYFNNSMVRDCNNSSEYQVGDEIKVSGIVLMKTPTKLEMLVPVAIEDVEFKVTKVDGITMMKRLDETDDRDFILCEDSEHERINQETEEEMKNPKSTHAIKKIRTSSMYGHVTDGCQPDFSNLVSGDYFNQHPEELTASKMYPKMINEEEMKKYDDLLTKSIIEFKNYLGLDAAGKIALNSIYGCDKNKTALNSNYGYKPTLNNEKPYPYCIDDIITSKKMKAVINAVNALQEAKKALSKISYNVGIDSIVSINNIINSLDDIIKNNKSEYKIVKKELNSPFRTRDQIMRELSASKFMNGKSYNIINKLINESITDYYMQEALKKAKTKKNK